MSANPYQSPVETGVAKIAKKKCWPIFVFIVPLVLFVPGLYVGFSMVMEMIMPPPPPPGRLQCGNPLIPFIMIAMYIGAPVGGLVFAFAGSIIGHFLDRLRKHGLKH